jgi:hypothetical protein
VIVEIDPLGLAAAIPAENQPPLVVDADRIEARQVAPQLLKVIAGRHTQILIGSRIVDHLELAKQPAFEIGGMCRDGLSSTKKARSHSSRKLTIMQRPYLYLYTTHRYVIQVTGMIVPSLAKGQPFEMQASAIHVIGWVEDPDTYPIQTKAAHIGIFARSRASAAAHKCDRRGDARAP